MNAPKTAGLRAPLTALGTAFAAAALVTLIFSTTPGESLYYLLAGPFMNRLALGNLLAETALLILAGSAAMLAFGAGSFNLGGEGQAYAGGLTAAALALALPKLPRVLALPTAVLTAMAAGALMGVISGLLRKHWDVNELISSFLLSMVVLRLGDTVLGGPMKDAESYLIAAPFLPPAYRAASWWPPSHLNGTVLWSLAVLSAAVLFLNFTRWGYEWRLRRAGERFARYGGIKVGNIAVASLGISGALFGLAGAAALLGEQGRAVQGFTSGLGWDGLAVALIAALKPAALPVAALVYAWLSHGTRAAMVHSGFPHALSEVVRAVVFLLVTATVLGYRRRGIPS